MRPLPERDSLSHSEDHPLPYPVIRCRRRTIAVCVHHDATVTVRAPRYVSREDIHRFVREREVWIRGKQQLMRARASERPARFFVPGERFPFLGASYPLELADAPGPPLTFDGRFVLAPEFTLQARQLLEKWYRAQASRILRVKVIRHGAAAGLRAAAVRITGAKTRWGSCTGRGSLNFSWRLILAPEHIVDYVVAHEVAHLSELNHSERFWRTVEVLAPQYRVCRDWLREHGHLLDL